MPEPGRLPHAESTEWAPYRSPETGEVVTVTWDQINAIAHAMKVVDQVRAAHGVRLLENDIPQKSRALGRLLFDGKPLYVDKPPLDMGAAAYWRWDAENDRADGSLVTLLQQARFYVVQGVTLQRGLTTEAVELLAAVDQALAKEARDAP